MLFILVNLIFATIQEIEFTFDPQDYTLPEIKTITVAGNFNGWNTQTNPLKKVGKLYKTKIKLQDGIYYYKFVVNGNIWLKDKKSDPQLDQPDGYGGFNSGILVGESGMKYGQPLPNDINKDALKHNPTDSKYFNVIKDNIVEITLRTLENDISDVKIFYSTDEEDFKHATLSKHTSHFGFDFYLIRLEFPKPQQTISYYFLITDGSKQIYYCKDLADTPPNKNNLFFSKFVPLAPTPNWSKMAVWYQIMPERFRNGNTENDPPQTLPWGHDWFKPGKNESGNFYNYVWGRYFGGDIQGLIKKLPYLKDLGINAIYLTPVFESNSYQKYNTDDYRHIDDNLGYAGEYEEVLSKETLEPETWQFTKTDKLFLSFLSQAHKLGMKVIIDGVFNHSGENFWAFNDLKNKGRKSQFKDWYIVNDWDAFEKASWNLKWKYYQGWAGFGGLPEYKEYEDGLHPSLEKHIFDITKRWMDPNQDGDPSDGIDGWRLDVPDCVTQKFWFKWCSLVKKINPDAYITGEIWGTAPDWLNEKLFHAQMNYPFAKIGIKFFVDEDLTPSDFAKDLEKHLSIYPTQIQLVQQNLWDSHDTDRVASMIMNPNRDYDKKNRLNPNDGDYNPNYYFNKPTKDAYQIMKLMTVFQFTFVGAPMIWYGDEVGMWGCDDPTNRKPMLWDDIKFDNPEDKPNKDMLAHYKKIIALRNTYPAIQFGIFKTIYTDNDKNIFVYLRKYLDDIVIVAINNDRKSQKVSFTLKEDLLDTELFDVLNETRYEFSDTIEDGIFLKKIIVKKPKKIFKIKNHLLSLEIPKKSAKVLVKLKK